MYYEALLLFAKRICNSTCETNVGNVADHVGKSENSEPPLVAGLIARLLPRAPRCRKKQVGTECIFPGSPGVWSVLSVFFNDCRAISLVVKLRYHVGSGPQSYPCTLEVNTQGSEVGEHSRGLNQSFH